MGVFGKVASGRDSMRELLSPRGGRGRRVPDLRALAVRIVPSFLFHSFPFGSSSTWSGREVSGTGISIIWGSGLKEGEGGSGHNFFSIANREAHFLYNGEERLFPEH